LVPTLRLIFFPSVWVTRNVLIQSHWWCLVQGTYKNYRIVVVAPVRVVAGELNLLGHLLTKAVVSQDQAAFDMWIQA